MKQVLATPYRYDVEELRVDVDKVRGLLDFDSGRLGQSISVPGESEIAVESRQHPNNRPYADALASCPALRNVFDAFRTDKYSFRLLRRPGFSAYPLHDDHAEEGDYVRVQIPIQTNDSSLLMVLRDGVELPPLERRVKRFRDAETDELDFDYARFVEVFGDFFDAFTLESGRVYWFDVNRVHTLINGGSTDRITLCLDIELGEWLDAWMPANLTKAVDPVPPGQLPRGRWNWTTLPYGLV